MSDIKFRDVLNTDLKSSIMGLKNLGKQHKIYILSILTIISYICLFVTLSSLKISYLYDSHAINILFYSVNIMLSYVLIMGIYLIVLRLHSLLTYFPLNVLKEYYPKSRIKIYIYKFSDFIFYAMLFIILVLMTRLSAKYMTYIVLMVYPVSLFSIVFLWEPIIIIINAYISQVYFFVH